MVECLTRGRLCEGLTCETTLPLYTWSICGSRLAAKVCSSSGFSRMNCTLSCALVGSPSGANSISLTPGHQCYMLS